jgi:hypothetical protein
MNSPAPTSAMGPTSILGRVLIRAAVPVNTNLAPTVLSKVEPPAAPGFSHRGAAEI